MTLLIEDIRRRCPTMQGVAREIVVDRRAVANANEINNATLCSHVLQMCAESENQRIEMDIGAVYIQHTQPDVFIGRFKEIFVQPMTDYLDETCETPSTILAILVRYKQKCEWFQRDYLFNRWHTDPARGEDRLAFHLYEFLFDCGVPFSIEPRSITGRADLVTHQHGVEPFLADAKVFAEATSKSYLAKGLHQVCQYCEDHNYPFGSLVIFNVADQDVQLDLPTAELGMPYLIVNHKIIFIHLINIYPVVRPASARGKLQPVTLNEKDMITISDN